MKKAKKKKLPSRIDGLEVKHRSNDHLPHHFHVYKKGEWEIRVYFLITNESNLQYDFKWNKSKKGLTRTEIEKIISYALKHRIELIENWDINHANETNAKEE